MAYSTKRYKHIHEDISIHNRYFPIDHQVIIKIHRTHLWSVEFLESYTILWKALGDGPVSATWVHNWSFHSQVSFKIPQSNDAPPKRVTFFEAESYAIDAYLGDGPISRYWIRLHISGAIVLFSTSYSYRFCFSLLSSFGLLWPSVISISIFLLSTLICIIWVYQTDE